MDSLLKSVENCLTKLKEDSDDLTTVNKVISEARNKITDDGLTVSKGEFKFFAINELLEEIHSALDQKTPIAPQQPVEVSQCTVVQKNRENLPPPPRAPTPTCSVKRATEDEYSKISKYMARNLSLNDLNTAIEALERAILERLKLRKAKFHDLSKSGKDKVLKIREEQQGLKLDKTAMYCSEEEWKDCLDLRMKAKLKWAIQMLRHIRRIRDTPFKGAIFIILL